MEIVEEEEIEEHYLLLRDSAEQAALDNARVVTHGLGWKVFGFFTLFYLFVNTLSRRTPGPAHWLAIDAHVQLFHHLSTLI